MLWLATAWREELRQLLLLLAGRADHRLHPLPWSRVAAGDGVGVLRETRAPLA